VNEISDRLEPFVADPIGALPFLTPDLPGVGGEIKVAPAHFVVEEIPLYEACGEGEHVYVCLTREGQTTRALEKELARLFHLRPVDVGYAGLKDKHARVTQTFSLLLHNVDEEAVAARIEASLPVEVVWARRHRNKLKAGHLLGNRFRIVVLNPDRDAPERAGRIVRALKERGVPNFYGAQRFGLRGDNALRGRQALTGRGPRQRWLRRLLLSAYQSALFNAWLAERVRRGWFDRLLAGDVAKKTDTGGLFDVEDVDVERPRFERREITYTGPIYGSRLRWAGGEPGDLERQVLEAARATPETLGRAGLKGSRRQARLFPQELNVTSHPEGLQLTLALPKGSYATTVLREVMKRSVGVAPEE
jgi:tRNA pseudouridine13 synthase